MDSSVTQAQGVEVWNRINVGFRRNPEVMAQPVDDGAVLVHMITNRIFELNATAARLWELLADELTLPELHARLLSEFEVEPERLEQEVSELVALLLHEHLIATHECT